ncbi:MAG: class I SAM-dependent methyltransferase [Planctomycetales bacterium]|nr:class I SAM-dependent methyltransferase [Planctomycetales bacterium]
MSRSEALRVCRQRMESLVPYLSPNDRVLDFGCGIGGKAIAISDHVAEVVGVDINPWYIGQARRLARGRSNCHFQSYQGGSLPFSDDHFEVVYSWAVFERIPKTTVAGYVRDFYRVLKPGGLAAIYFLRYESSEAGFADLLGEEAYVFYRREEVDRLLADIGFVVQEYLAWPNAHVCLARKLTDGQKV